MPSVHGDVDAHTHLAQLKSSHLWVVRTHQAGKMCPSTFPEILLCPDCPESVGIILFFPCSWARENKTWKEPTQIVSFQYLKGACRKAGEGLSAMACCGKGRRNWFKLKVDRLDWILEEFVTVEWWGTGIGSQRSNGCPIPGHWWKTSEGGRSF